MPTGKYIRLDRMTLSVDKGDRTSVQLRYREYGGAWRSARIETMYQQFAAFSLNHGMLFAPKTDFEVRARVRSGTGGIVSSALDGFVFTSGWYDES